MIDAEMILAGCIGAENNTITPQLITSMGATFGTNVVDLYPARGPKGTPQPADMGEGTPLEVGISILKPLTSSGSAVVAFQLVQADDPGMTSNLQVLAEKPPLAISFLPKGSRVLMRWTPGATLPPKRYVALRVLISGASLSNTEGWLFAALTVGEAGPSNKQYASGYSLQ